ncbi:MAG: hypothetical protein H7067_04305 [Burkholderiales bacterium]|nr:hypothetical protein [Opitutaceae bacterium]
MQLRSLPALLALVTGASLSAATLLDEPFDSPTEITYHYPSAPGEIPSFHDKFSGWARDGIISVAYGTALGAKGSGGMLCTVETPSPTYMVAQYQKLSLPISDPAYTTSDQIKAYKLEFDARLPKDRVLTVFLNPTGAEGMGARQWGSRLVLGRVTGTGEITRYSLAGSAASPQSIAAFLQFIRDANLNGLPETVVDIVWLVPNKELAWAPGDSFQIDNVKLSNGL